MRKKTLKDILLALTALVLIVVLSYSFVLWTRNIEERYERAERENLELVIRRALAACYTLEGSYPPDIDYICTHYGVQIDYDKYNVFYEVFAENLMPEITVTERK